MERNIFKVEFIPYYLNIAIDFNLTPNEALLYGFIRFYTGGNNNFYFSSEQLNEILNIKNADNLFLSLKKKNLIETETIRISINGVVVSRRRAFLKQVTDLPKSVEPDLPKSVDMNLPKSVDIIEYNNIYSPSTNKKEKITTDLEAITTDNLIDWRNSLNKEYKFSSFRSKEGTRSYEELKREWNIRKKEYNKEEFYNGMDKYLLEIKSRKPNSSYAEHRFSLYEWIKQKNALMKFSSFS